VFGTATCKRNVQRITKGEKELLPGCFLNAVISSLARAASWSASLLLGQQSDTLLLLPWRKVNERQKRSETFISVLYVLERQSSSFFVEG
jgi:hypothetical protein